jgi:F420-non-reducing hydrogenase large subunit
MRRITIDPITRLEGHGKIDIFLNDAGDVENAYLIIPELRGFEKFCQGRHVEELPRITPKICGVCPEAHHLASAKALDAVYHVEPPRAAKKLRELFYAAHMIHSHIAHFYALAAPDFVVGPDAPAAQRNILGVIAKVGVDVGKEVIKHRAFAQDIQSIIGGRATYPVCGLPGGNSRSITEEERKKIEVMARSCVEFSKFSFKVFDKYVLAEKKYLDAVLSHDIYYMETNYMGMVDKNNRVNFYDGHIRVVSPQGNEIAKFDQSDYLSHIAEQVEPWTYMKFAYLKNIGWKGFVDGADSGVMRVAPLARLNAADAMATPFAQAEYERLFKTFGTKPVHNTMAFHWARLVELMYASERLLELALDPEITSPEVRIIPTETPTEGVGIVEAPRGTLIHHYKTDTAGMSVAKAAKALIKKGNVTDGLLNMVEMAFRAYDPCMSCATHSLPGQMPLIISLKDKSGRIIDTIRRD